MDTILEPHKYSGEVTIPSSKAEFHRLLFALSLSDFLSTIDFEGELCADVLSTISSLKALGAKIKIEDKKIVIHGFEKLKKGLPCNIDVGESGTTYRFLLPRIGFIGEKCFVKMHGRLPWRPIADFTSCLSKFGLEFKQDGDVMQVNGRLTSGNFVLPGNISSQYISSLLLTLPFLTKDSSIRINGKLESYPYIKMTIDILKKCGIEIEENENEFNIKGSQKSAGGSYRAFGDYSSATFFACIAALSDKGIYIKGLDVKSRQGDKVIFDILKEFGAVVEERKEGFFVKANRRKALIVDACDIPDMVMSLAVLLATADGKSVIKNCQRLEFKESNRIDATIKMLSSFGVKSYYDNGDIYIIGQSEFDSAIVDTFSDHRIAMSASVLSQVSKNPITIKSSECVNKSYPEFFKHLNSLQSD